MKRESRRISFAVTTIAVASFVVSCSALLKKKDADEDPDLSALLDAQTTQITGTGAKNETAILRYANETQLGGIPALIGKDGIIARNFPGNGPIVSSLPKGTVVAKIAQYFATGVLVMFDDPIGDGSKLLGWVPVTSFDVAAPPPTRTIVVPRVDAAAPKPVQDAGGPTPTQDAGGKPAVDAGNANDIPAETNKNSLAVLPNAANKCSSIRVLSEGMCRLKCTADANCPRNSKCVAKPGGKVCTMSQ